jgi:integrase
MTRRGHGDGSIYRQNDKLWAAAITLPNGRRQVFYAPTRTEAAAKLNSALHARNAGVVIPTGRETVDAFFAKWLAGANALVRPRTWQRYEQLVRLQVLPTLGRLKLTALAPGDLQGLYAHLLQSGLSPASVHHTHMLIHRALGQGVRWGDLSRNVADQVDPPRVARAEMRTLSSAQVAQLLESTSTDRMAALWVVAITTGMRQGELLGLQWRNVDLEGRFLQVVGSLQPIKGEGLQFLEPKTVKSRRRVQLGNMAVEALKTHRTKQKEDRIQSGGRWQADSDWVFANSIGGPVGPFRARRMFWAALKAAGLPAIRFHDLRHTAATLMLARGVHPKVASEMLGHSTVAITLDLYSHVSEPMHRSAAEAIEAAIRES